MPTEVAADRVEVFALVSIGITESIIQLAIEVLL
jgi:hypothetical protein